MMRLARALVIASVTVTALTACSGGNSASPGPTIVLATPTPSPQPSTLAKGSATIVIPNRPTATTGMRKRLWVSPSTQSVSITATAADGYAGYVITAVPAGSPNCTAVSGGRSCTLGFVAPPGTDTVAITAYDATNSYQGNPVATTTVSGVDIAAQGTNPIGFTLGGIVGVAPVLSPASFTVTEGAPETLTLTITGEDYDNNPISLYDAPLAITQTDTTGDFTLSATSIADSSVTPSITIAYDGGGTAATTDTITVESTSAITAADYGAQEASVTVTVMNAPIR